MVARLRVWARSWRLACWDCPTASVMSQAAASASSPSQCAAPGRAACTSHDHNIQLGLASRQHGKRSLTATGSQGRPGVAGVLSHAAL